ncbi:MAG: SDR family NAD(P)-dependent oxidoreductase, partial [Balneolaceae bacterium]
MDLTDKVCLVTGGSRGIGREIAMTLAANGAKVAITYARSSEAANEVVSQITGAGGNA